MSRLEKTGKNFAYSILATIVTSVVGFMSRTIFIHTIGIEYLGANSLFTNILSLLSLTELGISSAICYNLYAPLATGDIETIKSLMNVYKKAYRVIGLVIVTLGLALLPFLKYLIKDPGNLEHIPVIYLIFLYNTAISYFFTYKLTLMVADQKSYVITNTTTIINIISAIVQLVCLLIFQNYFLYLGIGAVVSTVQWPFINRMVYKKYPYLKDKDVQPLADKEKKTIVTNVKAMVFHKMGELCINQTDNIIISSFINIATVGLYNNYYLIIHIINNFSQSFFNSASASLGNMIATETCEYRHNVFKRYNFLGFWIYGWTGLCLYVLLNPFVELWLGKEYLIDGLTLELVIINYYLVGMRITIGNVKMAAGLYRQDQWAPIVQAIVNLAVSIVGAIYMGLAGVFLGTVVSGLVVPCWYRPVVVYKHVFNRPVMEYFIRYLLYVAVIGVNLALVLAANSYIVEPLCGNVYLQFLLKALMCAVIPNVVIIALFHRGEEFRYLLGLVSAITKRKRA